MCISKSSSTLKTFLQVSLTSDLHLTDEDAELVLHPAPDGEPVAGLLRLDQSHLVHNHTGVGRHLGGPANKTFRGEGWWLFGMPSKLKGGGGPADSLISKYQLRAEDTLKEVRPNGP